MINFLKQMAKKFIGFFRIGPGRRMFWIGKNENCPNFGDLIGPYLYQKITGSEPKFSTTSNLSLKSVYMSAGSIMSWCRENSIIWGSGIVYREQKFPKPKKVYSVRGPLTREAFLKQGYTCPPVYGDPGLLMPIFYTKNNINPRFKLGVVPHYVDKELAVERIKSNSSTTFIDVFKPIEKVIDDICNCEVIVSSSLHGVIIANAYGIPVIWCKFSDLLWGDDIKFHDHFASLNIFNITPLNLFDNVEFIDSDNLNYKTILVEPRKLHEVQEKLIANCPFFKK